MQIRSLVPSMLAVALMTGAILAATLAAADDGTVRARNDGRPLAPVLLSVEIVAEESDGSAFAPPDRDASSNGPGFQPRPNGPNDAHPPRPEQGAE